MQKIHSQNEHSFLVFPLCLSHNAKRNKKRLMCLRNSQMHFMTIIYVKLIICEVLMNMMHSSCKHITRNMNFIFFKMQARLKMCFSFLLTYEYATNKNVDAIKKKIISSFVAHFKMLFICRCVPSRRELVVLLIGWSQE